MTLHSDAQSDSLSLSTKLTAFCKSTHILTSENCFLWKPSVNHWRMCICCRQLCPHQSTASLCNAFIYPVTDLGLWLTPVKLTYGTQTASDSITILTVCEHRETQATECRQSALHKCAEQCSAARQTCVVSASWYDDVCVFLCLQPMQ